MPAKVQLKLLSNSGELLSIANCCAGKISVLRASTPSDLRPYQRALGGSTGKDNLEILCDGAVYNPEEHTLMGFGEPSPTTGLTVKEFATNQGMSELALAAQLISVGLDDVLDKRCAELTLDQEARLRILVATADPDKAIVLNDPFENISSKWRERLAELLAEFTQTRNALIIIPSLSYRPEAWIANQCVERIEVGQTSQKTIGFGSAGSQSNVQINDIRNQLRSDPRFAGQTERGESRGIPTALAAGVATGIHTSDLTPSAPGAAKGSSLLLNAGKLLFALVGSSVGGWAIFTAVSMHTNGAIRQGNPGPLAKLRTEVTIDKQAPESKSQLPASADSKIDDSAQQRVAAAPVAAALATKSKQVAEESGLLLDGYPALIKASIIDTARGLIDFQISNEPAPTAPTAKQKVDSGNLFSLLEAASNSKGNTAPGRPNPPSYSSQNEESEDSDDSDMTPEEAQREAIRNRFLEAIRASAQRRQAAAEEEALQ